MKKLLLAIMLMAVPFSVVNAQRGLITAKKINAKSQDISHYLKGAVPEVDGKVVFSQVVAMPGKTKEQIYQAVASFYSLRFAANSTRGEWRDANFFRNIEYANVTKADKASGHLMAQGAEEMIFSNKTLSKDYTHVYYNLDTKIEDGKLTLKMQNIFYVYVGSDKTERIPAEEWITDKEGLNKKGEPARISGKFRIKTIDLFDELCEEAVANLK